MADDEKQKYLIPSVHFGHDDPGMGAAFALGNYGTLTDSDGNLVSGHRLIAHDHAQPRAYQLSEAQWKRLCDEVNKLSVDALKQHRTDNRIPIPKGSDGPIETLLHELEEKGAPSTPISASEEKKLAKNFKHMAW